MKKRKYMSEFALNMHQTHAMLTQQDELKSVGTYEYFDENNPCHIYFICRRPRITVDPEKFSVDNDKIVFAFKIQRQDKFEEFQIKLPNTYGTINYKLNSVYPYNYFELLKDDKVILCGKAAVLLHKFGSRYSHYLDLEVLYIGQSYGVDGSRIAPDRLESHATLQGIYAEAIIKNPDCEIWLMLTSYEQILLTSIDGTMEISDAARETDTDHLKNVAQTVLHKGLNEKQVINFTEAALIRYFQPPYNIEFKDTFPNPAHKSYQECYDLDINSICIEVNTDHISCQLYSENVERKWSHMHDFFLHSREERVSMFDLEKAFNKEPEKES